jgi:RNA polymerase sigma-70 factor (ECF subfamily)
MTASTTQTIQNTKPLNIFQGISRKDQTAVKDCIDSYDNFIRALARKFTNSTEEAEAATQEIFIDIWRYSQQADKSQSAENLLIALIARRRLIKRLH